MDAGVPTEPVEKRFGSCSPLFSMVWRCRPALEETVEESVRRENRVSQYEASEEGEGIDVGSGNSRLLCTDIDQLPESLAGSKTEGGCAEGLSFSGMPCVKDEIEGSVTLWPSPEAGGGAAMAQV